MRDPHDIKPHAWLLTVTSSTMILISILTITLSLSSITAITPKNTTSNNPSVQGTTTSAIQEQKASLNIHDRGNNKATILLTITEETQIAGMEIYVKQKGGVRTTAIECTDVFTCIDTVISEDHIEIIAIREPDDADSFFQGTIPVADITYDASSPGYLEINGPESEKSSVFSTGMPENLLSDTIELFELGY